MTTITVTTDNAQLNWQETLHAASANRQEVVIEKQGLPVATLVNYALFEQMKHELLVVQGLKRAERNRQERLEDLHL